MVSEAKKAAIENNTTTITDQIVTAFASSFDKTWKTVLWVWLLCTGWKFLSYYVLCSHLESKDGIYNMNTDNYVEPGFSDKHYYSAKRISVPVSGKYPLTVKDENYLASYIRNLGLSKKTVILFSNKFIMMSLLNGLSFMTRLYFKDNVIGTNLTADLSSMNDADDYLMRIDINPSQAPLIIMPSNLVAYGGDIKIESHWRLNKLIAWCIGQFRFYTVSGDGYIVLEGRGGLQHSRHKEGAGDPVIKMRTLVASDSVMKIRMQRTETFLPYLLGKCELLDMCLTGTGSVIQKNIVQDNNTIIGKTRDSVFNIIGKLLGF